MKYKNKAFTLIELLVTISIIGILATLMIANYNSARQRARDTQRKSDLRNIQTALRLYYNDCGKYPKDNNLVIVGCDGTCTAPDDCQWNGENPFALSEDQNYMNILPQDPQLDPNSDTPSYKYDFTDDDNYVLSACLENKSDEKCKKNASEELEPCPDGIDGCIYEVKP